MIVKMAARNLMRRKRRTLITAGTIAFGLLLSFSFTAMGDYSYTNMIDASAKMGYGHVTVEPLDYNDRPSLKKRIPDVSSIRQLAMSIEGVADAPARITGKTMFATASKTVGGMFIGIDPSQENSDVNLFIAAIKEGDLFESTDGRGAVIGSAMAKKMNLKIGKKFVWTATDVDGEIVSQIARVSAIFTVGVNEVDSSMVLLPIDRVRKTLGYKPDEATMVCVRVEDQRLTKSVEDKLRASVSGDVEVLTWRTTQADMAGMIAIDKGSNYLFQLLVGLLVAAGVLNTIFMGVLERTREFGIMLAIGARPRSLFATILTESFFLTIIGVILGSVLCIGAYWYMTEYGIDFSEMMEDGADLGGVLIDPVMRFRFYPNSALTILIAAFILTMTASIYPAVRASRIPPVDSIKTI